MIVAPFRDSPAEKAGVLPGDVLLSVNGESAEGWTVADAVKKLPAKGKVPDPRYASYVPRLLEDLSARLK